MAPHVLVNAFAYVGGYDFTGDAKDLQVATEAAAVDRTNFRSGGFNEAVPGLRSMSLDLNGYAGFSATESDVQVFNALNAASVPLVGTCGYAETEGALAYLSGCGVYNYQPYGEIGQLAPMKLSAKGRDAYGLVRGTLLKKLGNVAATGATGTGVQAGAVLSTQYLYGTFHTFGTPGTTVTAVLESATANTFVGATTRATFGPITSATGVWATRVAGPITDTWWRLRVTAITGTWSIAAALGIQ